MKSLILIGLVIALLAGGVFFMLANNKLPQVTPSESQMPITTTTNEQPEVNKIVESLRAGGSSYSDPNNNFVFLYPSDYKLDTQDTKHIRIYKVGPTQKGQTEMYDGSLMVFEVVNLGGKTLSAWIDEFIKEQTKDGTLEVIEAKKPITINNYQGFTFTLRGLGLSKYILIQKDNRSQIALNITTLVADPGNLGFQKEQDAVLSTIELLK